jgi:hypothetical protein
MTATSALQTQLNAGQHDLQTGVLLGSWYSSLASTAANWALTAADDALRYARGKLGPSVQAGDTQDGDMDGNSNIAETSVALFRKVYDAVMAAVDLRRKEVLSLSRTV